MADVTGTQTQAHDAAAIGDDRRSKPSPDWSVDLLEGLNEGVVVVDSDLKVLYRNGVVVEWLGQADTVDELFAGVRFLSPFDKWTSEVHSVIDTGVERRIECVPNVSGEQPTRILSLSCTRFSRQCDDRIIGVLISIGDSTQRYGLEERLATSERLAAIGKLAARVAHELNNPLDGILRYVNLALRITEKSGEKKLSDYLGESRTGLMRMVDIVRELLAFSRTSREQFDLTGINELVEQAVEELSPKSVANRIVVTTDFQNRDMPGVRGSRLYQVCCNLIKNAIDAMPDGGRLAITTGLVGDDVVIRVADTGPGLPDEADKVFEPFFTTKQVGKGTGLGLAICKDFVEGMEGTIETAPGEDGGAVFTVRIPVSQCHQMASTQV